MWRFQWIWVTTVSTNVLLNTINEAIWTLERSDFQAPLWNSSAPYEMDKTKEELKQKKRIQALLTLTLAKKKRNKLCIPLTPRRHSMTEPQHNQMKEKHWTLMMLKPQQFTHSLALAKLEWVEHDFSTKEHTEVLMPWIYAIIKMCYVQEPKA